MNREAVRQTTADRINWDLIDKTLGNIEQGIGGFGMSHWARRRDGLINLKEAPELCDTVMCFAGWAVHTHGEVFDWRYDGRNSADLTVDGDFVGDLAQRILGLTSRERLMFSSEPLYLETIAESHAPRNLEELENRIYAVLERSLSYER